MNGNGKRSRDGDARLVAEDDVLDTSSASSSVHLTSRIADVSKQLEILAAELQAIKDESQSSSIKPGSSTSTQTMQRPELMQALKFAVPGKFIRALSIKRVGHSLRSYQRWCSYRR
jgi:hypothetical protein